MASIRGHEVAAHPPWGVLAIGCEVHTSDRWRAMWREIAEKHGADVTAADEAALMAALDMVAMLSMR
jgi:hypothetical protein